MDFETWLYIIIFAIPLCFLLYLYVIYPIFNYNKRVNELSEARHTVYELRQELSKVQNENEEQKKELKSLKEKNIKTKSELTELTRRITTLVISNNTQKIKYDTLSRENTALKIKSKDIKLSDAFNAISAFKSNLTAFPYMAGITADIETYGIELLASKLDWGHSQERLKKVKSIREIRRDAKAMVEKNKEAQYQLAYLLELFPTLSDVIECDYNDLPAINVKDITDYDAVRDYLTKEEYESLSAIERNQLALDRYNNSHKKSKWQIGRDYELYVGYKYSLKGYKVDYFGSYMGLEDLGRDLIAKKSGTILIIQCKYWGSHKLIHEKHVTQLYGTLASYCIENNLPPERVKGVLVTNTQLSDMAKKMAEHLNINYMENYQKGEYPCIKCNIGHDELGETYIYHLPFDQQYDSTKIEKRGEFYAMTVAEAEEAGFRRAFKWHGNN